MENNNQEVVKKITPTVKISAQMHYDRLGRIFTNISFTIGVILLVILLSTILLPLLHFFVMAILFVGAIALSIFSLGLIYLTPNNPASTLWSWLGNVTESDFMGKALNFVYSLIPYLSIAGLVLSALAIVMISLTKKKGKAGKLAGVIIFAVIMLIALVLYLISGGTLWQG